MSNYYYIDELPKGMIPVTLKIIYQYQWKDPGLVEKPMRKIQNRFLMEAGILSSI